MVTEKEVLRLLEDNSMQIEDIKERLPWESDGEMFRMLRCLTASGRLHRSGRYFRSPRRATWTEPVASLQLCLPSGLLDRLMEKRPEGVHKNAWLGALLIKALDGGHGGLGAKGYTPVIVSIPCGVLTRLKRRASELGCTITETASSLLMGAFDD